MSAEAKTVEYCLDSNVFSAEEIKKKIETTKKSFAKISKKPVEVRVELNETGMYIITFKFYPNKRIFNKNKEKRELLINKYYVESIGDNSEEYFEKLLKNKYLKRLQKQQEKDEKKRQEFEANKRKEEEQQKELKRRQELAEYRRAQAEKEAKEQKIAEYKKAQAEKMAKEKEALENERAKIERDAIINKIKKAISIKTLNIKKVPQAPNIHKVKNSILQVEPIKTQVKVAKRQENPIKATKQYEINSDSKKEGPYIEELKREPERKMGFMEALKSFVQGKDENVLDEKYEEFKKRLEAEKEAINEKIEAEKRAKDKEENPQNRTAWEATKEYKEYENKPVNDYGRKYEQEYERQKYEESYKSKYGDYRKTSKKKNKPIPEEHYWSKNYIPKEYGKYKPGKTFKPF